LEERIYSQFTAQNLSIDEIDAEQVSFRLLNNLVFNRIFGGFLQRGGSHVWEIEGDIWGIDSFSKTVSGQLKIPVVAIPVRHRFSSSTSFFEKLNWSTLNWDSITLGANTSPGTDSLTSFAQIDQTMVAACGVVMKIQDIDSGSFTRLGGPAPTTAPGSSLSAGALTGDFVYYYTFYDSTTAWESSPSPFTDIISPSSEDVQLTGFETTVAREGVDKKRIYRTVQTAENPPLFLAEIPLAQTTYDDDASDDSLGLPGPDIGDHDPPPNSYLMEAHQNRFWIADPVTNKLYYSLSYDGNPTVLEYFSESRFFAFNNRITGLRSWQGRLLVFTPPGFGIFEIVGSSVSEFEVREFLPDEGTSFPSSVAVQDRSLTYWGAAGPVLVDPAGVNIKFDRAISEQLRPILTDDYNANVFISAVWHPGLEQFLFFVTGAKTDAAQWVFTGTTLVGRWIDSDTSATAPWESS